MTLFSQTFQHTDRPQNCVAQECKCKRGRKHSSDNENSRYLLICCDSCGSSAVHRCCLTNENYLCNDCITIQVNDKSDLGFDESVSSSNIRSDSENSDRESLYNRNGRRNRRSNARINSSQSSSTSRASSSRSNMTNTAYSDDTDDEYSITKYRKTETANKTRITDYDQEYRLRDLSIVLSPLRGWYPEARINSSNQTDESDDEHEISDDYDDEDVKSGVKCHNSSTGSEHNNNEVAKSVKRNFNEMFYSTDDNDLSIPIVSNELKYMNNKIPLSESNSENYIDKNVVHSQIKLEFEPNAAPQVPSIAKVNQEEQENENSIKAVPINKRARVLSTSSESHKASESSSDEANRINVNLMSQRKHKFFITNFFPSSSEDSSSEAKRSSPPKRMKLMKTPRKLSGSAKSFEKSPNQPSIKDMFNAQLNRSG